MSLIAFVEGLFHNPYATPQPIIKESTMTTITTAQKFTIGPVTADNGQPLPSAPVFTTNNPDLSLIVSQDGLSVDVYGVSPGQSTVTITVDQVVSTVDVTVIFPFTALVFGISSPVAK
jgi:hypothetical protein